MQPSPIAETSRPPFQSLRFRIFRSLRLQRSHVDGETIFYFRLQQSLVSFVHFLDRNDFHVCCDVVGTAKIEHFLRLCDASNDGARETAAPTDETEGRNLEMLRGCAHQGNIAAHIK